jgi:ATP-dependent HslUV protease ATP-binding subunit HslU
MCEEWISLLLPFLLSLCPAIHPPHPSFLPRNNQHTGKTEIARRVALLSESPFVKVEATKYTEVGYYGKDVDSIIADLIENSIKLTKGRMKAASLGVITEKINNKIVDAIVGTMAVKSNKAEILKAVQEGKLDKHIIKLDLPKGYKMKKDKRGKLGASIHVSRQTLSLNVVDHNASESTSISVEDARRYFIEEEMDSFLNEETIVKESIKAAEETGIVFIDEIDKIARNPFDMNTSGDASDVGVQRDLLPIIEGGTVDTKYGKVNTDHILFICAGAFSAVKPEHLLPELQGRLPIRVQLAPLSESEIRKILTETDTNLIAQQVELFRTEGVNLVFTENAVDSLAKFTVKGNKEIDNIGARRLHTVIEAVVEELSFKAPDMDVGSVIIVDDETVNERMKTYQADTSKENLMRYVF